MEEKQLTPVNPAQLMQISSDVAAVCAEIVRKTAINIKGCRYVPVEAWMAIATAHGTISGARDVERVENGFRAIGELRRILDGALLATAEGFVGEDECVWFGGKDQGGKTWPARYEYAIRAMAQTRAISRVCRSAFAHVVVLIDSEISTTPAEEVGSTEQELSQDEINRRLQEANRRVESAAERRKRTSGMIQ